MEMNLEIIKQKLVLPNSLKASSAYWWTYDVVKEPNIFFQLDVRNKWKIRIATGMQEGIAVGSGSYDVSMSSGSTALPSRKWDEFKTETDAAIFYLIEVIQVFEKKNKEENISFSLQPAIDEMMNCFKENYLGKQLTIF
jgi:hypothetical protein